MLIDVSLAISVICSDSEKRFIPNWADGQSNAKLALMHSVTIDAIKKRKPSLSTRIADLLIT